MSEETIDLKMYAQVVSDPRYQEIFNALRPESISAKSSEGTNARLDVLRARGLGGSRSETIHVVLQLGLFALEEAFGVTSDEEE